MDGPPNGTSISAADRSRTNRSSLVAAANASGNQGQGGGFWLRPAGPYLFWQLCLQVWAWLSQVLMQGAPNVVGQTRLQESFWLAQLAKQASVAASANRHLPLLKAGPAIAAPIAVKKSAALNRGFIKSSGSNYRTKAPAIS